jgi:hypothetical protein
VLVAWNAPWLTVTLSADPVALEVRGASAAPALSAIAIACVALAGALSIAPRVFRYIAAAILAALGIGVVLASQAVLADPIASAERSITTVTGVAGSASVRALVASFQVTGWPYVAVGAGALLVLLAAGVGATAHSWTSSGRRYAAPRATIDTSMVDTSSARQEAPKDVIPNSADDWDSLTGGGDPTS